MFDPSSGNLAALERSDHNYSPAVVTDVGIFVNARMQVGPAAGEVQGNTGMTIQMAVDAVAALGGGTVEILPGTYILSDSINVPSRVRLLGHGEQSLLRKADGRATELVAETDWYHDVIRVADPDRLAVGDGICLRSAASSAVAVRRVMAKIGDEVLLDRKIGVNLWRSADGRMPTVDTTYPLVRIDQASDVAIEHIRLDGNRAKNAHLDGNYSGCIWMQDVLRARLDRVQAVDNHGDGISWQVCHDVVVEGCLSSGHAGYGLHPGSGSLRTRIRKCCLARNHIGIFFCWGVRHGVVEGNEIVNNDIGVSLGHRDTDNQVLKNVISGNGKCGILFRAEKDAGAAAHGNEISRNVFLRNGGVSGPHALVDAPVEGVVFANNEFIGDTGHMSTPAILISNAASRIELLGNSVYGNRLLSGIAGESQP
jgi:parallel beta-helix repeat protein